MNRSRISADSDVIVLAFDDSRITGAITGRTGHHALVATHTTTLGTAIAGAGACAGELVLPFAQFLPTLSHRARGFNPGGTASPTAIRVGPSSLNGTGLSAGSHEFALAESTGFTFAGVTALGTATGDTTIS